MTHRPYPPGEFFRWIAGRVDLAVEKHGMMRDPEIELISDVPVDLLVERFKAGRPRVRQYDERSPEELRQDVTRVTDISMRLITERDGLLAEKGSAEIAAGSRLLWIQILSAAATVELLLIGFFAAQFFARLK